MNYQTRLLAFLGAAVVACLGAPVEGQDTLRVTLVGEVRNFDTEEPIEGAAVKVLELGLVRLTDRNGFFAFEGIPAGSWTFETSQFGYEANVEASDIGARNLLLIRLKSQPIEVEGLYVEVMRGLIERRMSVPVQVYSWDRPELSTAISPDIGSYIRTRGAVRWVKCGGEFSDNDTPNCILRRNRIIRLQVFVDDIPIPSKEGLMNLWAYDPRDLWAVEIIPECAMLRIYTDLFMERVRSGRERLTPFVCVP